MSAKLVAQGLIDIFSRTALLMQILLDRGGQFTGHLMKELCRLLHIETLRMTAYHPQTNGTVERMHGMLKGILKKAVELGLDWVLQLPFAMFALRQAPHKGSGLSPFELVFGSQVRMPLELLYYGWTGENESPLDVCSWVEKVRERIELARDVCRERMEVARDVRKEVYDRQAVERNFSSGGLVWQRLPGFYACLEEAWAGPFEVLEKKTV